MLDSLIANVAVQTRVHLDMRGTIHSFNCQALPQQMRVGQAGKAFEAKTDGVAALRSEERLSP